MTQTFTGAQAAGGEQKSQRGDRRDSGLPGSRAALCTPARTHRRPKWASREECVKQAPRMYTMEYCSARKGMRLVICRGVGEPRVCHTE